MLRYFDRVVERTAERVADRPWSPQWIAVLGLAFAASAVLVWMGLVDLTYRRNRGHRVLELLLIATPLCLPVLIGAWAGVRLVARPSISRALQRVALGGWLWLPLGIGGLVLLVSGIDNWEPVAVSVGLLAFVAEGVVVLRLAGREAGSPSWPWPLTCCGCCYPLPDASGVCPECGTSGAVSIAYLERTRPVVTPHEASDAPTRRICSAVMLTGGCVLALHLAYGVFVVSMGSAIDGYDADTLPRWERRWKGFWGGPAWVGLDLTAWCVAFWLLLAIAAPAGRFRITRPWLWMPLGYVGTLGLAMACEPWVRWPSLAYERDYWMIAGFAVTAVGYLVAVGWGWRGKAAETLARAIHE